MFVCVLVFHHSPTLGKLKGLQQPLKGTGRSCRRSLVVASQPGLAGLKVLKPAENINTLYYSSESRFRSEIGIPD